MKDGLLSFSDPQRLEIFRDGFRVVGCKWTREVCKGGATNGIFSLGQNCGDGKQVNSIQDLFFTEHTVDGRNPKQPPGMYKTS